MTRQAYYQHSWRMMDYTIEAELVVKEVLNIRQFHKRMGGRKMFEKLQEFMLKHQVKMGRDAFFDLLSANNLLVKRRKRKAHTTNSFHWLRKYPNLIKEFTPTQSNQLWVSDITYLKTGLFFLYISLITDAYSHKIVGYQLAETLEAIESITALEMALKSLDNDPGQIQSLIHHSDRGVQYCSHDYVKLLKENDIQISMTENGDPLENPVAERVNGILKDEYLLPEKAQTKSEAIKILDRSVILYNTDRPHMSIANMTPEMVHTAQMDRKPKRLWKNYYKTQKQNVYMT